MRRTAWVSWGSIVIASLAACVGDAPTDDSTSDSGASDGSVDGVGSGDATQDAGQDAAQDGGAQDAQPDTSNWTPQSLTNLVLWLDGTRGLPVPGAVARWEDQSGQNHFAAQASPSCRPHTFGPDGGINGQGVVRFAGGYFLRVADHADFQWSTGDFLVAEVIRHDTATQFGALFDKQTAGGSPNLGPALWANFVAGTGQIAAELEDNTTAVSASGGYNDSAPHIVVMQRTGATLTLRVDKSTVATNLDAGQFVSSVGTDVTLGANPLTTQSLVGDIAEVIAVKGPVVTANMSLLEAYFSKKYGLP